MLGTLASKHIINMIDQQAGTYLLHEGKHSYV
jgi:hypothetical protein